MAKGVLKVLEIKRAYLQTPKNGKHFVIKGAPVTEGTPVTEGAPWNALTLTPLKTINPSIYIYNIFFLIYLDIFLLVLKSLLEFNDYF